MESNAPLQDRLWRVSHAHRFLERRRRIAQFRRVWKDVKQVAEWAFVIVVVLGFAALIVFLLFGMGNPLP